MEGSSAREGGVSESDTVPTYLMEQNSKAHALAYRLQQAFVQARIEGLGKPFEVIHACILLPLAFVKICYVLCSLRFPLRST